MVSTLEEAQKLKDNGYPVEIQREVRYRAIIGNTQYELQHDWEIQRLEEKLWKPTPPKDKTNEGERV